MMKRLLILLILTGCCWLIGPFQAIASADILNGDNVCKGGAQSTTYNSAVCVDKRNPTNPVYGKNGLLIKIANVIAFIAGAAAIIVIIVGALKLVTSGGDSGSVSSARGTIASALIGLVIVALAATIIDFVVNRLLPS
jgi:hypothetical protein